MTTQGRERSSWEATRSSFDELVNAAGNSRLSVAETDLLAGTHWNLGQDARLRDDVRFRRTPWGQWIPSGAFLANDALRQQLRLERRPSIELEGALAALEKVVRRRCVFCPADPGLVLEGAEVRLASRELTDQPLVESAVEPLERYQTHLPLHTLRAAAASAPLGEWGRRNQEEVIDTLGWVRVTVPGRSLNPRMFVARVEGQSGEGWAWKDLPSDDRYAVFELWPSGTKQNQIVLVRGAFSDPETGNYAVKKYVGDERGADGTHRRITLKSLHPDKERFPDIVLEPSSDDEITVVAKFVHSLSPADFVRRPRPHRRRGRRDVASPEARAEVSNRLAAYADRFFEAAPSISPEGSPPKDTWTAELVCLDKVAGGLHLELGPLRGLWSFVKRLRLVGDDLEVSLLASNVRERSTRIRVPPASGPWRWGAVDFEDDPDVDLSMLEVPSLEPGRARVFHVDSEGVGRGVRSSVLSQGQRYRILVPAALAVAVDDSEHLAACGPGWYLWEVEVPSPTPAEIAESARSLGLGIGVPVPTSGWVVTPPAEWRRTPRGDAYACFDTGIGPVAELVDAQVEVDGEAEVFLCGPHGTSSQSLPVGERHLLHLDDLRPGRYVLEVVHQRVAVALARTAFEVLAEAPALIPAEAEVVLEGDAHTTRPGEVVSARPRDLSAVVEASTPDAVRVTAPPGWPVRVAWKEIVEETLLRRSANEQGVVDPLGLLAGARERVSRRPIGDVLLDFAELGRVSLPHDRHPEPESVRGRLAELLSARAATVERLAGAYSDLLPIWFEPVCAALGFDVEWMPDGHLAEPPEHATALRLLHVERQGSRIDRQPVRLLVLVERMTTTLSPEMLSWIDEVCAKEKLRETLLSDGLSWAAHRRASKLALRVWDLGKLIGEPEEFVLFLHVASEGV